MNGNVESIRAHLEQIEEAERLNINSMIKLKQDKEALEKRNKELSQAREAQLRNNEQLKEKIKQLETSNQYLADSVSRLEARLREEGTQVPATLEAALPAFNVTINAPGANPDDLNRAIEYLGKAIRANFPNLSTEPPSVKERLQLWNSQAIEDVRSERARQVGRGFSPSYDKMQGPMMTARGAAAYLTAALNTHPSMIPTINPECFWPWNRSTFKPEQDHRALLVIAAAMIIAQIEAMDE